MNIQKMSRDKARARNLVNNAWNRVYRIMNNYNKGGNIRPTTAEEIFRFESDLNNNQINIEVKPIVFNVPERSPNVAKLYICVKGRIAFSCPFGAGKPKTKAFSTSVGYFRPHQECLDHVYGVRYDFDTNQLGHPVFHAQMDTQMCFSDQIRERYRDERCISNKVETTLKNVRIPTAEMDIFSVFVQIIADHLIHKKSNSSEKKQFSKALDSCGFFHGAAQSVGDFCQASKKYKYRSMCWYHNS